MGIEAQAGIFSALRPICLTGGPNLRVILKLG
jgi:hypothetical protein